MINYYCLEYGELKKCEHNENLYWIEMIKPTYREIHYISDKYNIPLKYLEDIKDIDEISRVEGLEDDDVPDLFMLSYPEKLFDDSYTTRVMSIILSNDILITAIDSDIKLLKEMHLTEASKANIAKARENLILEIVWTISQEFILAVKDLNLQIYNLENFIKKSSKTEEFYKIINIQKSIIAFDHAIDNNGPVINEVHYSNKIFLSELSQDMLFAMEIEFKQAKNMITKAFRTLEQLSDLYSSVISNNLNVVMKVLTSITIVLTIPTIIGGFWGMNTQLPISDSPYSFYYLLGLTVLISFIIIYLLKKYDYL